MASLDFREVHNMYGLLLSAVAGDVTGAELLYSYNERADVA